MRDGKSIIIEGLHLDPGMNLHEFGAGRSSSTHAVQRDGAPTGSGSEAPAPHAAEMGSRSHSAEVAQERATLAAAPAVAASPVANKGSFSPCKALLAPNPSGPAMQSSNGDGGNSGYGMDTPANAGGSGNAASAAGIVFVPVVLEVEEGEHRLMAAERMGWQEGSSSSGSRAGEEGVSAVPLSPAAAALREEQGRQQRVMGRLRALQFYLSSYVQKGVTPVAVRGGDLERSVDALHDIVLTCIADAMALHDGNGGARHDTTSPK
jgi:hypothetical protein